MDTSPPSGTPAGFPAVFQTAFFANIPYWRYGSVVALKDIGLNLEIGSFTAIVGPNGGGKSTLMKLLAGIYRPQAGKIICQSASKQDIAYLPQHHELDRTFPFLAEEVVAMGLWPDRNARTGEISSCLNRAGLSGFEKRSLNALSGGEFQRLLFARLIAQKASIILLDEPFIGVDQATIHDLMALMVEWHGQGKTIAVILHDLTLVRAWFPQTLVLSQKIIAHGATAQVLAVENLAKAAFNV